MIQKTQQRKWNIFFVGDGVSIISGSWWDYINILWIINIIKEYNRMGRYTTNTKINNISYTIFITKDNETGNCEHKNNRFWSRNSRVKQQQNKCFLFVLGLNDQNYWQDKYNISCQKYI